MILLKVACLLVAITYGISIIGNSYQRNEVSGWRVWICGAAITGFIMSHWLL